MITVFPKFVHSNLLKLNPANTYIIKQVSWIKGSPASDIIDAAKIATVLESIGFTATMDTFELDDEESGKVLQVAKFNSPGIGEFNIAIIDGPDYELIKESMNVELERKIVEEKAIFKLNLHPPCLTIQ